MEDRNAGKENEPSSKTPAWQARQKAFHEADEEARARSREDQRLWRQDVERHYHNRGWLLYSLAVIAIILLVVWFLFVNTHCNPFFSDLANSKACRYRGP